MLFLTAGLFGCQLYISTMEFITQKTTSLMLGRSRHIGKDPIQYSLEFSQCFQCFVVILNPRKSCKNVLSKKINCIPFLFPLKSIPVGLKRMCKEGYRWQVAGLLLDKIAVGLHHKLGQEAEAKCLSLSSSGGSVTKEQGWPPSHRTFFSRQSQQATNT